MPVKKNSKTKYKNRWSRRFYLVTYNETTSTKNTVYIMIMNTVSWVSILSLLEELLNFTGKRRVLEWFFNFLMKNPSFVFVYDILCKSFKWHRYKKWLVYSHMAAYNSSTCLNGCIFRHTMSGFFAPSYLFNMLLLVICYFWANPISNILLFL